VPTVTHVRHVPYFGVQLYIHIYGQCGDRIPVGTRFYAPVQIGFGAHPASYPMGTVSVS